MGILDALRRNKRVFACKPCAVGRELVRVGGGRDEKDTCAFCHRRRYGDWYEIGGRK